MTQKKGMTQNNKKSQKGVNIKSFTQVHRKVGIVFMPLLLVIVITGGWSLFRAELLQWQFPHFKLAESQFVSGQQTANNSHRQTRLSLQELINIARDEHGFDYADFSIHDKERFGDFLLFFNKSDGIEHHLFLDPVSGEALDASKASFSETVYDLHLKLLLPTSIGKYLVGLLGLLLLYLVFTGFLAHKNIKQNFYRLRLHKGRQIFATDLHKLLGNWSLVFSALMSITGALLGLFMVVLLVLALAAYGGDLGALFADFLGKQPKAVGGTVEFLSLDSLYQQAQHYWDGYKISTIEIHNYADPAMRVTFEGELINGLLTQQHVTYDAINGGVTFVTDFTDKGVGGYIYSVLPSLHFASFGGTWIKLIYWVLTLILLLVMITGITIKSLRLRERPFSFGDICAITLSQAVILASSVAVFFAVVLSGESGEVGESGGFSLVSINPGNYATLAVITLLALVYTLSVNKWFKSIGALNSVVIAGWILILATAIVAIKGQWLLAVLCLSLGLTWLVSQKIGAFVSKGSVNKAGVNKAGSQKVGPQ